MAEVGNGQFFSLDNVALGLNKELATKVVATGNELSVGITAMIHERSNGKEANGVWELRGIVHLWCHGVTIASKHGVHFCIHPHIE